MKRWLRKHCKPVLIGVILLATANAIYGIIQAVKLGNDLYLIIHTFGLIIFSFYLLVASGIAYRIYQFVSGVAYRIYQWWEKD